MKLLLVTDIGNTETVIGLYSGEKLVATWRFSSKIPRTPDELWILLKMWCLDSGIDFAAIQAVIISSVVPSLTAVFQQMVSDYLKLESLVVSSETDTGLKIQYQVPQQVGADRICNAVAGAHLYGTPVIIVDLGTATTFDVVSPELVYLGGVISLGLAGASNELHRLAAKLPRVDLVFPAHVVGRSTEESMQSGIMWGSVALIDGMIEKIQDEMQWDRVAVAATGGAARLITDRSKRIEQINMHLTLEGMKIIYHRLHGQR
ncbi:type III pantothenate kinase [bacterium]|nr:type III pantothenate kinase [bacterium]